MLNDLWTLTRPFRIMLYSALALQALAGVVLYFPGWRSPVWWTPIRRPIPSGLASPSAD